MAATSTKHRRAGIHQGAADVEIVVDLRARRTDSLSDESLLVGMAARDRRATTAFVRRFQRRVYGLGLSIVGDPLLAEDVAQEALTRAWRHAQAYDPRRGAVSTWLLTITRNVAIDAIRLHRPELRAPADLDDLVGIHEVAGPADAAVVSEERRGVRAALRNLPDEQRRALVLSAYAGRTAKEIAEIEGIPLGTAKTRIRAGLGKLRAVLADEEASS